VGKVWVLDTETKGTGANMVPLERVTKRSSGYDEPLFKAPTRRAPEPAEAKQRAPRKFRVVDVMTRQTLADGANARAAIEALRGIRSVVDVEVYVWQEERERWRKLTLPERQEMIDMARTVGDASGSGST
jgi:hypothetical protein